MKFFSRNKQNKDRNNKYKRYRKPEMQIQTSFRAEKRMPWDWLISKNSSVQRTILNSTIMCEWMSVKFITWRWGRSEVKEGHLGSIIMGFLRRFARSRRMKGDAININRSLETRGVIRSIFHSWVFWQAPLPLMAHLL